jgi:hypothetical protein
MRPPDETKFSQTQAHDFGISLFLHHFCTHDSSKHPARKQREAAAPAKLIYIELFVLISILYNIIIYIIMIEICGHHLVITCSARYLNPLEAPCDPCGDSLRGIFQERRSAPSPSSGESCHMSSKHCTSRYILYNHIIRMI